MKELIGFYRKIMILLDSSKSKEDKLYRAALKLFHFPGVSGINLAVFRNWN